MSIKVVCPNGHALKVNDTLAGRTGLCPKCRARVVIPIPSGADFSEDAILGLLNTDAPVVPRAVDHHSDPGGSGIKAAGANMPKKLCNKCNREIAVGMHICPHCHTYIAALKDF